MNCYFEGDLPRANPAWETAQSRKGDHLASPPGSRRPQNNNYSILNILFYFILFYFIFIRCETQPLTHRETER